MPLSVTSGGGLLRDMKMKVDNKLKVQVGKASYDTRDSDYVFIGNISQGDGIEYSVTVIIWSLHGPAQPLQSC